MNLMIKGIDMPRNKGLFYDLLLSLSFDGSGEIFFNRKSYPITEISTPHGDLSDRDDLLAYFEKKSKGKTAEEALKLLYTALKAYPTVIEKEMN